jgi:hypothetical protein
MISVTYGGSEYVHPGFGGPREFHRFVIKHGPALDSPLMRLAPRVLSAQRDLKAKTGDAMTAGFGAVMACAAEVADLLEGRPSSAMSEALTSDAMYDLVDTVCGACTVAGEPCGTTHNWHRDNDPWGPHIVALLMVWMAQGFPMPGGSLSAIGAEE